MKEEASKHVPQGWAESTVGDIAEAVISGSGFPKKFQGNAEGEYPFAKVGDISRHFRSGKKKIGSADHYISESVRQEIKAKLFPEKTIVFPKIGEALKGNYRVISDRPMLFDNNVMGIAPDERLIGSEYLFYFLTTQDFGRFAVATAVPSVRRGDIESINLLLPPFAEQHRIVAKIEELFSELDKGVESLKTAREQLKVYRQAVLKHAFEGKLTAQWREENKDKLETADQLLARIKQEREAYYEQQIGEWTAAVKDWEAEGKLGKKPTKPRKQKPVELGEASHPELPNGWTWESLGNLNVDVFDGPFGSNLKTSDYVDEGIRVIRLENIGYLEFVEEKYSYVTEEKYESIKKHTVQCGDIVFSSFVTDGIRVAILPDRIDRAVNKADCFCVRLCGDSVRNDFVASFLSTRSAYKQIESDIHGVGRPRINTTQLKNIAIPICSAEEQKETISRMGDRLSLADHIGATIEHELARCEALRQAVLKCALSGHLVEQDPSDEPASVLLDRIRTEKAAEENPKTKKNKNKDFA